MVEARAVRAERGVERDRGVVRERADERSEAGRLEETGASLLEEAAASVAGWVCAGSSETSGTDSEAVVSTFEGTSLGTFAGVGLDMLSRERTQSRSRVGRFEAKAHVCETWTFRPNVYSVSECAHTQFSEGGRPISM